MKATMTVSLDVEVIESVERKAKKCGRSRSNMVEQILREKLAFRKAQPISRTRSGTAER